MKNPLKGTILILVPGKNARGGITNYYKVLEPLFTLPVIYLERGARQWPIRGNFFHEFFRIVSDIVMLYKTLRKNRINLVQTTTSFSSYSILRDAIFIIIARCLKCKIIVFFRGKDEKFILRVEKNVLWLFRSIYFKADAFIDLSRKNTELFKSWGYKGPIFLETTLVSDELLQDISEEFLINKYRDNKKQILTLLYLARIEISKGVYEALKAFHLLQQKYQNIRMIIAGDGREENNVRTFVTSNNIENVTFTGFVEGEAKKKIFIASDIYLFPSYSEGMPNSVLEAIGFGLPVVSTCVGGLEDFFVSGTFGYLVAKKNPEQLAEMVERLIKDRETTLKISLNNYNYAKDNFLSTKVVKRIESIFEQIINS